MIRIFAGGNNDEAIRDANSLISKIQLPPSQSFFVRGRIFEGMITDVNVTHASDFIESMHGDYIDIFISNQNKPEEL